VTTLSREEVSDIIFAVEESIREDIGTEFYVPRSEFGPKLALAIEAELRKRWFSEPIAFAGKMPGVDAWTTAVFPASHVPEGTEVFIAPQEKS